MITKTCPECQGVIEIDETRQIPGSTVEAMCQLCGFTVMVEIPRSVARQNEAQQKLKAEQSKEYEQDLLSKYDEFQLLKLEVERLKKQAQEAQKSVVPPVPVIPKLKIPPVPKKMVSGSHNSNNNGIEYPGKRLKNRQLTTDEYIGFSIVFSFVAFLILIICLV